MISFLRLQNFFFCAIPFLHIHSEYGCLYSIDWLDSPLLPPFSERLANPVGQLGGNPMGEKSFLHCTGLGLSCSSLQKKIELIVLVFFSCVLEEKSASFVSSAYVKSHCPSLAFFFLFSLSAAVYFSPTPPFIYIALQNIPKPCLYSDFYR
jgi:hypothetical protein